MPDTENKEQFPPSLYIERRGDAVWFRVQGTEMRFSTAKRFLSALLLGRLNYHYARPFTPKSKGGQPGNQNARKPERMH